MWNIWPLLLNNFSLSLQVNLCFLLFLFSIESKIVLKVAGPRINIIIQQTSRKRSYVLLYRISNITFNFPLKNNMPVYLLPHSEIASVQNYIKQEAVHESWVLKEFWESHKGKSLAEQGRDLKKSGARWLFCQNKKNT